MSSTENPWQDVIGLEQENVPTVASASENRERRVARDGVAYTHDEFIEHYGMERGTEMWGEAADRNREQFILPVMVADPVIQEEQDLMDQMRRWVLYAASMNGVKLLSKSESFLNNQSEKFTLRLSDQVMPGNLDRSWGSKRQSVSNSCSSMKSITFIYHFLTATECLLTVPSGAKRYVFRYNTLDHRNHRVARSWR